MQADPRSPEHGQYGFLQDLAPQGRLRDALRRRDRKARHLAAAAYLEQALDRARTRWSRSSPPTTSPRTRRRRTPPTRPRSGRRPHASSPVPASAPRRSAANEEAQRYFAQAAELADDPLAEAELAGAGRAERLARRARRAGARATSTGRSPLFEAEGLTRLGGPDLSRCWPRSTTARATTNAAVTQARGGPSRRWRARSPTRTLAAVAAQLGRFLVLSNRDDERAPHSRLALELAEALRLPEVFAQALTTQVRSSTRRRNRLDEARILLEGALAGALANDLNAAAMRAINNLAVNHESSATATATPLGISARGPRARPPASATGSGSGAVALGPTQLARAPRTTGTRPLARADSSEPGALGRSHR